MEITGWITLGAVIVALGLGVASILHTQRFQKQERRERLLNEIKDWAIETLEFCTIGVCIDPTEMWDIISKEKKYSELIHIIWSERAENKIRTLRSKGIYLRVISLKKFKRQKNLVYKLDIVMRHLRNRERTIKLFSAGKIKNEDALKRQVDIMTQATKDLIEEVVNVMSSI